MTLHQIIFNTIEGDMVVIQGTNKKDIFKDAYARLLSLPVNREVLDEWCIKFPTFKEFYEWLNDHCYYEFPIGNDDWYINTWIHYNTWKVTE